VIGIVGVIAGVALWRQAQSRLLRWLGVIIALVCAAIPALLILSLSNIPIP
jgi:uncharacterized membrane protein